GNTEVDVRGAVYGMPDVNRMSYNLNIAKLQSSRKDIETLLPPATLKQIRLPDRFGATGTISGTSLSYKPHLIVFTTDGNASVHGQIDMSGGTEKERYNIAVKTQKLNVGSIIRNPQLGAISADIRAKGTGFDIHSMNAEAEGKISSASFNQ